MNNRRLRFGLGLLSMLILNLVVGGELYAQIAFWQSLVGGEAYDSGRKILCLADGTIVEAIQTRSTTGIGENNHSEDVDVVIRKIATQGKVFWSHTIGGSGREEIADLIPAADGGFLCIGTTDSQDGDFPDTRGATDIWAMKLSGRGDHLWTTTLGGSGADYGWCVLEEENGDILLGAESSSINGDMQSPHHGGFDAWLAKLNSRGRLIMEKHFGGPGNEKINRIHAMEGGYRLICSSDARGGDVHTNYGKKDLWIVSVDLSFSTTFRQIIGGNDNDDIHDSLVDQEGNLILAGTTFSSNGYVSDQHGKGDGWIIKFDSSGMYQWSHAYGGSRHDGFSAIAEQDSGGYVLVGMTLSTNGHLKSNEGYYDGWLMQIDPNGKPRWSRNIGYPAKDALSDIVEVAGGGFLAIGHVQTKPLEQINIPAHAGVYDSWMVNFSDPERGLDVKPFRTPSIMFGEIVDKENGSPLLADITLTENSTLDSLTSTASNLMDGGFVLLLPTYGLVSINVLAKGYLFYGQDILTDSLANKTTVEQIIRLQPIRVGSSLVLENIYFETGRWEVLKESFAELNRLVAFLELNPGVKIEIAGHTDNTGNRNQKIELSLNRAEAIRKYLETKGIAAYRMSVKGFGMYRPRASNTTPEGRRLNRRVEFTVTRM